jgi:hypothetical protein
MAYVTALAWSVQSIALGEHFAVSFDAKRAADDRQASSSLSAEC